MVARYIADMGQPRAFYTGEELTRGAYIRVCDGCGIRHSTTATGTPKPDALVKSSIWRAVKAGHATRM